MASASKKLALQRLFEADPIDIIFLQETPGINESVVASLESLMPGWSFAAVDAKGHSRGLAIGWYLKKCNCERFWGFESVAGKILTFFADFCVNTRVGLNETLERS